jgi:AraC-like DNA-binding protein
MLYIKPQKHPTRFAPDYHDLVYLIEGTWGVQLEGEEIELRPGDTAMLPAGFHYRGSSLCSPNTRTIYIHFEAKKGDRPLDEKNKKQNLPILSHTHQDSGMVIGLLQELIKTIRFDQPHRTMRCSTILNAIIFLLADSYTGTGLKRDAQISRLLGLLIDRQDKFFSIPELAGEAGLSRKSLTSRFRAETGQSVHQYQMNSKLDQIAVILKLDYYVNLKNIALNFGFYDEYHLSSCFKKRFGLSPIKYKQQEEKRMQ